MLRQALDEAENHEKQQQQLKDEEANAESSSLVQTIDPAEISRLGNQAYGSISGEIRTGNSDLERDVFYDENDEGDSDAGDENEDDDDDEEEYLFDTDDDWESERSSMTETCKRRGTNLATRAWELLKGCFILVVNVENVWDSPAASHWRQTRRRKKYVILFWFVVLASSYTTERVSYKLLVDRSGPFRLFAVEMVAFTHAFIVGSGMLISAISRKDFTIQPLGIPIVDVGLMALLDTIHILLVFLTGYHVAPTWTVILVQFTIPLTALLSQFVHPDGYFKKCCGEYPTGSNSGAVDGMICQDSSAVGQPLRGFGGLSIEHISGSILISLAVLLALFPSMYTFVDNEFFTYAFASSTEIPIQTAYNTILFLSSCIPAAASQLYKEYIFLQYKQPVQQDYLNFVLSVFQLIFASIMSPLVYMLLGFYASNDWVDLYPAYDYSKNFGDGFKCFIGILDEEEAKNGYHDEATCSQSFSLVALYSFSVIFVGVAVDKIVNGGATRVMYRGVSAGIILSVTSLYIYDLHIPDFSYGPVVDSLNLVCLILLVVGSEIYHRVSLQDASFETVYPEIESFFDDVTE